MNKRKILCFLGILLTLGFASPALGQSTEEETSEEAVAEETETTEPVDTPSSLNFSLGGKSTAELGNYFWGFLGDQVLLAGTTAVAVDAGNPSVLYAGGPGYIAVSDDNGANWEERFNYSDSPEDEIADSEDAEGEVKPAKKTILPKMQLKSQPFGNICVRNSKISLTPTMPMRFSKT